MRGGGDGTGREHLHDPGLSLLPLLTNTLPRSSASEVTTLWHYTNLFIILLLLSPLPSRLGLGEHNHANLVANSLIWGLMYQLPVTVQGQIWHNEANSIYTYVANFFRIGLFYCS